MNQCLCILGYSYDDVSSHDEDINDYNNATSFAWLRRELDGEILFFLSVLNVKVTFLPNKPALYTVQFLFFKDKIWFGEYLTAIST